MAINQLGFCYYRVLQYKIVHNDIRRDGSSGESSTERQLSLRKPEHISHYELWTGELKKPPGIATTVKDEDNLGVLKARVHIPQSIAKVVMIPS